jgi:predicted transcriptional regulator
MKRTTISLPDDVADALAREARRRAVPASAIARDALTSYFNLGTASDHRVLPFAGVGHSGHRTTARDMEELLAAEWDERSGNR